MGPLQLLQVEDGRCHQILHQNNPVHQFVIMDADTPTTTSTMALWTGGAGRGGVAGQGTESMERVWGESRPSTVQVLSPIHCYARACNVLLPAPPADLNGVPVFWLLQPLPIPERETGENEFGEGASANGRAARLRGRHSPEDTG